MWIVYLALAAALLFAGMTALVALAQTRLLFPVGMAAASRPGLPPTAERLSLVTPDGVPLAGVRLAPEAASPDAPPLLLGFGGNAWNADAMALLLHGLFPDREVVAFHYRGYSPSGGEPSAGALLADSLAIFDHLQRNGPRRVTAVGFSLGSGVAAHLAHHRVLAGTILVTPFDSLEALAREHFPWAPVGLLLRHRMPSLDLLRDRPTPTALIVAGRDTIVPARRSEPLRGAIPNLVLDRTIPEAGHNDLYGNPAFPTAMHDALRRIDGAAR